ncbi:MAG: B12-binding domain-containing radical SAM protein [Candidatus Bathycorpusculaceae bacterium]
MKFSFINPGQSPGGLEMCTKAWPPLGMLYIAGVLMREGIEVSMLDQSASGLTHEKVVDWVKKEDPDILGFSVLHSAAKEAPKIAERVKKENPNIKVVMGNYHATFNAERILRKYPAVDIIVRGEGEYTCLELAKCLEKGGDLREVDGLTFRHNGKIVSTPDRPLIKNIDELPFPDRSLMNTEYTSTIFGVKVATKKFTTVLSSRGCPFRCTFCGCRKFARGVWRPRSVENIMEELHILRSQGYEEILFVDDNFTLNRKRVVKLCQRMRKEGLDIRWICDSRVDNSSYDMFREMVKAGCNTLYFGIESANQRILDYYKKGITPQQSVDAVRKARKAGIDVIVGSFIVGAPDETREEILRTLKFAQKLDIDVPSLNILGAFSGTEIWNDLLAKGWIDEEKYWETSVYVPSVSPHTVPFDEIRQMIYEHFREFYLRPKQLLKEVLRTLKSSYRLGVLLVNLPRANTVINDVIQGVRYG